MDPNTQRKEGIFSFQAYCQQNILLCAEKENTIKKIVWTDNPPHKTIARHQLEAMEHRAVWVFRNESSQVAGAPELVQGRWMLSGAEGTELGTWGHRLPHPQGVGSLPYPDTFFIVKWCLGATPQRPDLK